MSRVAQNLSPEGDASWPIVRNDIDVARFNRNALGDLGTQHTSSGGENVGQFALMFGVEVNNDNERGLNVVRQLSKNSCRARTPPADEPIQRWKPLAAVPVRSRSRSRGRSSVIIHGIRPSQPPVWRDAIV